jgi:hypothetical protein
MRLASVAVVLCLVLSACGGESGPSSVSVEDSWSGIVTLNGASVTLDMSLLENSGTVNGSGFLVAGSDSLPLTVHGSYDPPSVTLTLSSSGFQPATLTATVAENTMTGTLTGSGFQGSQITLNRQ